MSVSSDPPLAAGIGLESSSSNVLGKGSSSSRLQGKTLSGAIYKTTSRGSSNASKRSLSFRPPADAQALLSRAGHTKGMMDKNARRQVFSTLFATVLTLVSFIIMTAVYIATFMETSDALLESGLEIRRRVARSVMDEVALSLKPVHASSMHASLRFSMPVGTGSRIWPPTPEGILNHSEELLAHLWVHMTGDLHLSSVQANGTGKDFLPYLGMTVNIAVKEDGVTPTTDLEDCAHVLQAGIFLAEPQPDGSTKVTDNPLKFAYRTVFTTGENGTRTASTRWEFYHGGLKMTIPNYVLFEGPGVACKDQAAYAQMQTAQALGPERFSWHGPSPLDAFKAFEGISAIKNAEGHPIGYLASGFSVVFSMNPILSKVVQDGGEFTKGVEVAAISETGTFLGWSGGSNIPGVDNYNYVSDVPEDGVLGQAFRHLKNKAGNACPDHHTSVDEDDRVIDAMPFFTEDYGLPPLKERWCVIQSVPREKIYDEIDKATNMSIVALISMVSLFLCVVVLFFASLYSALRSDRQLRDEKLKADLRQVTSAMKGVQALDSPMALVSAAEFLQFPKLEHHEALRDRGALTMLDSVESVVAFRERNTILFLSHQWLSFVFPDVEDATQLEAMKGAIRAVQNASQDKKGVYIWCDYTSIAQRHTKMQHAAIASLPVYARMADKFIIVAPPAIHEELGVECNLETYNERGWCRAEMLAKACGSGIEEMYTCTDTKGTLSAVTLEDLSHLSLNIFEGKFTVREDVEDLVNPVLGLYSLVLRGSDLPHMRAIHEHIQADKGRFFPTRYYSSKADAEVELFGKCVGYLELFIANGGVSAAAARRPSVGSVHSRKS